MSKGNLTQPYVPNPLLKALYTRFFDRIQVDDNWVAQVRAHAAEGTVVYILRNLNLIDFLALDHLTKRHGFPTVRFVNDLGLWILNPIMGKSWTHGLFPRTTPARADELKEALSTPGGSAILFLKRPPSVIDAAGKATSRGRGFREGEDLMRALITLQRESDRPILLVPQVFVWTKRPDTRGTTVIDWVLGPREWPSPARVVGQFLTNYHGVSLRAGEAINLQSMLRDLGNAPDTQVLNKVVFTCLRRMERERLAITGPARKAPDRTRQEVLRGRRFQSVLGKLYPDVEARQKALKEADEMLRKMQALPDGTTASALDVVLDKVFQRIYRGIDVDQEGLQRVQQIAKNSTLVLLPSHKSHIDYLVVSYVFYKANIPLPVIVAGDNLSFFPMGGVFRRAGAFFIRRSFGGDRLYAAVVDAYVRRLFKDGYSLEVFLEGTRSRTGKLLAPKFGLLSMIVSAAQTQESSPVHFVPISIGYERIIETGSYHHEIAGGDKIKEDAAGLLSATEVLRHRYGRINVQFGQTLTLPQVATDLGLSSMQELSPKQSRSLITRLGNRMMDEINRVTAVTPGALTALALLNHHRRGLPHDKLVRHTERLHATLCDLNARCTPALATNSGILRREAIREAIQMFADADMIEVHTSQELSPRKERDRKPRAGTGAIYSVVEDRRVELDTSKNIIIHFFVERALLSTAMHPTMERPTTVDELRLRVQFLSRLLKHEFRFRADKAFEDVFASTLEDMRVGGEIELVDGQVRAGAGRDGWSGQKWLLVYASMIRNFVEGYRICARSLAALLDNPLPEKDLVKIALSTGSRMYLAGEIERSEAISKPVFTNALASFQDQGLLKSSHGKIVLAERCSSDLEVAAIESQIAAFLERENQL
jgi:glycerol-3-phosphate O-acyltransferase